MNYRRHKKKWIDCTLCSLCNYRRQVVLARGSIPADILLVGESPGESENALGRPFCGPAGHLLDYILDNSGAADHRFLVTNLVACIPRPRSGKRDPEPDEMYACADRLAEIVTMAQASLVITLGKLATTWFPKLLDMYPVVYASINHPASLLRMDVHNKELAIQRAVATVASAVQEHLED